MTGTIGSSSSPVLVGQDRRHVLVFVAFLQGALFSGIIYGWASIAGSLLVAPVQDGGANLTLDETTDLFAMATSTFSFAPLLLGYVLDCFGPRICSVLSHVLFLAGCLVVGQATSFSHYWYGVNLIAFGGPGIQSCCLHLSNLFTDTKFLVLSLISGSITISFVILPLFDTLWQRFGIGIHILFRTYSIVVGLSTIVSIFLWPDEPFQEQQQNNSHDQQDDSASAKLTALDIEPTTCDNLPTPPNSNNENNNRNSILNPEGRSLLSQLTSASYIWILVEFIVSCFIANEYIASLNIELADQNFFSTQKQHQLARIFTLLNSAGVLTSFWVGKAMDDFGLRVCSIATFLFGYLYLSIVVWFPQGQILMLVGFVVYLFFRQSLFPVFIAHLLQGFGTNNFGILSGLGFAISGITQLGIAPVIHAVQGTCHLVMGDDECSAGKWTVLRMIEKYLLILLVIFRFCKWSACKAKNKMPIQQEQEHSSYGSTSDDASSSDGLDLHVMI